MASISPPTTRGPQNPGRYPRTGPTYAYYGEQPGFIYNPWTDRYVVDPKAQKEFEEQQGIREKEPKQPSAGNQLATTIGGLAAGTAAVGLTNAGVDRVLADTPKVDPNASGGLIPKGDGAAAAGPTAATNPTAATPGAVPPPAVDAGTSGGLIPTSAPSAPAGPTVVGSGPVEGSSLMSNGSITFADGTVKMPDGVTVDPSAGTAVKPDGAPVEASNLGAYLQGAMAIYQGYQAYKQFKDGDKLGGTASGVSAGLSGAGALTGSTTLGGAGAVLGYYAPSYIKYGGKAIRGEGTAMDNAKTLALTNPVTAWAVPIIDGIEGLTGSKKGKDQQIRDKVRDYLQENKLIDKDYKGTLADGSSFDFGKDGKGLKLDFEDPLTGRAAGLANVISAGENLTDRAQEATAYLYAAAIKSNAKDENGLIANFQHLAKQRGFTPDAVQAQLNKQFAEKKITKEQLDAYSFELSRSLGQPKVTVGAPPPPAQPGPAPLQPGQTAGSTAAAATGAPAPSGGLLPPRTGTSPGFDKNGKRISYGKS